MSERQVFWKNWIDRFLNRRYLTVLYLAAAAGAIALLAFIQPFGDPPDEINRFKVVYYIANHGTLPNGYDEEVILAGYGGSYAFQPILSYIIMGYLVRGLRLLVEDAYVLIVAARLVNLVLGTLMAYYVLRIAETLFAEPLTKWLFACMVTFLPMNLFMHSYINTDSMALLSTAMIVYGMLSGEESGYDRRSCILLGAGSVLCIMSYYNAYGIVLVAALFFAFHFVRKKEWNKLSAKTALIGGIILAGAGWWFIRNGILYNGDLLGMAARTDCAIKTALPEYDPLTRFTYYGAGLPITALFRETQYAWLTFESLIAMFGPMRIPTHGLIYIYYKRLAIVSFMAALLPERKAVTQSRTERSVPDLEDGSAQEQADDAVRRMAASKRDGGILRADYWERLRDAPARVCFGVLMASDCLITMGLHLYYSYTWEYQPQGRYLLPMIIPAAYLMIMGIQKLCGWLRRIPGVTAVVRLLVLLFVGFTFAFTIFGRVLPVYIKGDNLSALAGLPFSKLAETFWP